MEADQIMAALAVAADLEAADQDTGAIKAAVAALLAREIMDRTGRGKTTVVVVVVLVVAVV